MNRQVSAYLYGHTHKENEFFDSSTLQLNTGALAGGRYRIVAMDNNGLSTATAKVGEWPVVLITAPVDKKLGCKNAGCDNPYRRDVIKGVPNPVRALVFKSSEEGVQRVCFSYKLKTQTDSEWSDCSTMQQDQQKPLWQGLWDTAGPDLNPGEYDLKVEVTYEKGGSYKTSSNGITVQVMDLDSDQDGMPDSWEIAHGLDPNRNDASEHSDTDGLTNLQEYQLGTDPKNADTDGDGYTDKEEIDAGTDPKNPNISPGSTSRKTLEDSINNIIDDTYTKLQKISGLILDNAVNSDYFQESVDDREKGIVFDFISTTLSLLTLGIQGGEAFINFKHTSLLSMADELTLTEKYPELIQILDKVGGLDNIGKAFAKLTEAELKALYMAELKETFIKVTSEERQSFLEELTNYFNEEIDRDMQALIALKLEALKELPTTLNREETDLYISVISRLKLGNTFTENTYSEKSNLINAIASIKKEDEEDWKLKTAEILWSGSKSLLGLAAGLYTGGILAPAMITAVDEVRQLFFDEAQLTVDAQMGALASEAMSEGFTLANTIYLNTFEALKSIRERNKPCVPKGSLSVTNRKVEKIFMEDTAQSTAAWMGEEFMSDVLMKKEDDCSSEANYFVSVLYKKPYTSFKLIPVIAERTYNDLIPVEKITELANNVETRLYYQEPPEEGENIQFLLFGKDGNKLYGLNSSLMSWDPIVEVKEERRESFSLFITSGLDERQYDGFSLYYNRESGNVVQKPTQVIKLKSPGELRVYDSERRLTGLLNGQINEGIPRSIYDGGNGFVVVLDATDSYIYEVSGTGEGTYGLEIVLAEEGGVGTFTATGIPVSPGVVHKYTVDWDILSQGGEGVTVRVDSDGNGIFERTVTSDGELKGDEFLPKPVRISGGAYFYPETPSYRASFSMDVTGPLSP